MPVPQENSLFVEQASCLSLRMVQDVSWIGQLLSGHCDRLPCLFCCCLCWLDYQFNNFDSSAIDLRLLAIHRGKSVVGSIPCQDW